VVTASKINIWGTLKYVKPVGISEGEGNYYLEDITNELPTNRNKRNIRDLH
jgi:hypothetical protein